MSNTSKQGRDEARTGGGIGDIPAQPVERANPAVERADPLVDVDSETGKVEGEALARRSDAAGSGEDPDDAADETQGHPS